MSWENKWAACVKQDFCDGEKNQFSFTECTMINWDTMPEYLLCFSASAWVFMLYTGDMICNKTHGWFVWMGNIDICWYFKQLWWLVSLQQVPSCVVGKEKVWWSVHPLTLLVLGRCWGEKDNFQMDRYSFQCGFYCLKQEIYCGLRLCFI